MPEIKERPILFSAPMVRAILEGRKTVTRRALNERALKNIGYGVQLGECHELPSEGPLHPNSIGYYNDFCPFGQPGDRLWVRETWTRTGNGDPGYLTYRATYPACLPPYLENIPPASDIRWKPSIHMFRADSRILLEITDIRVERLQGISDEQAVAEGCFFTDYGRKCGHGGKGWTDVGACPAPESTHQQREGWMWDKTTSHEQCLGAPRWAFANLWNAVNGPDAWDSNPWVWVIEFKQVMP